jgi:hypothetical protein
MILERITGSSGVDFAILIEAVGSKPSITVQGAGKIHWSICLTGASPGSKGGPQGGNCLSPFCTRSIATFKRCAAACKSLRHFATLGSAKSFVVGLRLAGVAARICDCFSKFF